MPRHTRYVSGLDIEIPWPHYPARHMDDKEADTLRIEVETRTWTPSLLYEPFPSRVLDELRNPYSKYRTRHDPRWVREREIEDLRNEFLATRTLLTPRGELAALKRAQKAEAMRARRDENGVLRMERDTEEFIDRFMQKRGERSEQRA